MAYIAAQRQAKFYPPWQAAAAADRALRLPQCTSRSNARDEAFLVHCGGSCIAAVTNLKVAVCIAAAHGLRQCYSRR